MRQVNHFQTKPPKGTRARFFEVAKDSSEIEKIERSLQDFLILQNSSTEIENFIKNPT